MTPSRRHHGSCLLLLILVLLPLGAGAQMTAGGVINGSLNHRGGIALMFDSDPTGVPLAGAASSNAGLNFGNVSMYGPVSTGVTRVRNANSFVISSPFNVFVDQGGIISASFNLSVYLSTAPGVFTYQMAGKTLTTATQLISQNDTRYTQDVPYTLSITIPTTAPAQTISNTVSFTVTAN